MKNQLIQVAAKTGSPPILDSRRLCAIILAFLFVYVVLILPVLCCSHPPFVDFPMHLARHYIVAVLKENLNHEQAEYGA
jgi:hypothetical protein